jgi:hypothetical protein
LNRLRIKRLIGCFQSGTNIQIGNIYKASQPGR